MSDETAMDALTPSQRETLHAQLIASRDGLHGLLADTEGLADTVTLDQSTVGRLSRMDALQQQAMAKAALRRHELRLQRVESALARMASDPEEFGICPDCAELIPWRRLARLAETIFCVGCAEARGG